MKFKALIGTSVLAMAVATPAHAQSGGSSSDPYGEIVVTAQRQSERLQDVPIAVSAFSAEALEKQQIDNASDLQLTLPNVTFSKGNFTGSSFTIRGIGDLCVGSSCDSATAIHVNGSPCSAPAFSKPNILISSALRFFVVRKARSSVATPRPVS